VAPAVVLVAIGLLAASTSVAAPSERFERHRIVLRYPDAWFVTTKPLSNGVNPTYRFTLSTVRVRRTAKDLGPCLPGVASQIPSDGVLAFVREAVGADRAASIARMQPRPPHFRLPTRTDNELCGFARRGRWIPFRESGRALYLGIYVGPEATTSTTHALQRALDRMRIDPIRG